MDQLGNGLAQLFVIEPHVLLAILGAELDSIALATGMYSGFLLAGGAKRVGIYLENGYIFRTSSMIYSSFSAVWQFKSAMIKTYPFGIS